MFNPTTRIDAKTKLVQPQPQPLLSFAFGIVDPDSHHTRWTQTMHKPVERRFQCFDRAVAPSDHGHVIVTLGQAARSCAECIDETQTPQLEQHVARRMTRDQKSICPSCPRQRDQTMNYSLAFRRCFPIAHGDTFSNRSHAQVGCGMMKEDHVGALSPSWSLDQPAKCAWSPI